MEKAIDKEKYEQVISMMKRMKERVDKYLKDVKDDLSKMPSEQFIDSVCNGNIANGSVYECNDIANKNFFDEVNREKELSIDNYADKCMKATIKRLLKEKYAVVDVSILDENKEWVPFAVACPFAGSDLCKLKKFRWVKGSERKEEKDWKRDYDL